MNVPLKTKVKHWFNFYKLALKSTDPEIIQNITSSKKFYEAWGDISSIKFDDWWKTHSHLFHQRQKIEVLTGTFNTNEEVLYLKVPLTYSPTTASSYFTRIYREEQDKRQENKNKVKKKYLGSYNLEPLEFPEENIKHYFIFAEKVYVSLYEPSKNIPTAKIMIPLAKKVFEKLSNKTLQKSREVKKQRIAPFRHENTKDNYATLEKTANRYKKISINLIRNASLGIFPGNDYQKSVTPFLKNKAKVKSPVDESRVVIKRAVRNVGYKKAVKIVDPDNPTSRKMYANVNSRKVYKGKY